MFFWFCFQNQLLDSSFKDISSRLLLLSLHALCAAENQRLGPTLTSVGFKGTLGEALVQFITERDELGKSNSKFFFEIFADFVQLLNTKFNLHLDLAYFGGAGLEGVANSKTAAQSRFFAWEKLLHILLLTAYDPHLSRWAPLAEILLPEVSKKNDQIRRLLCPDLPNSFQAKNQLSF